jgi:hypothetical protein
MYTHQADVPVMINDSFYEKLLLEYYRSSPGTLQQWNIGLCGTMTETTGPVLELCSRGI